MYIRFIQKGNIPLWSFELNSASAAAEPWDLKSCTPKVNRDY
jgi:hypothetical protein